MTMKFKFDYNTGDSSLYLGNDMRQSKLTDAIDAAIARADNDAQALVALVKSLERNLISSMLKVPGLERRVSLITSLIDDVNKL